MLSTPADTMRRHWTVCHPARTWTRKKGPSLIWLVLIGILAFWGGRNLTFTGRTQAFTEGKKHMEKNFQSNLASPTLAVVKKNMLSRNTSFSYLTIKNQIIC